MLYWGTPLTILIWTSSYSLAFQTSWSKSSCYKAAEKRNTWDYHPMLFLQDFSKFTKAVKKNPKPSVFHVIKYVPIPSWKHVITLPFAPLLFGLKPLLNLKINGQGFLEHEKCSTAKHLFIKWNEINKPNLNLKAPHMLYWMQLKWNKYWRVITEEQIYACKTVWVALRGWLNTWLFSMWVNIWHTSGPLSKVKARNSVS